MSRRPLNPEIITTIRELGAAMRTYAEIAEHLNIYQNTVRKYLVGFPHRGRGQPSSITPVEAEQLRKIIPERGQLHASKLLDINYVVLMKFSRRNNLRAPRGRYI